MAVEAVTHVELTQAMAALDPGTHAEPNMLRASGEGDRQRRRRQGVVPDLLLESAVNSLASIVGTRTLFELKQINFLVQYVQTGISKKERHAVKTRANTVHKEYVRKLHEVDKIAGTKCPGRRLQSGKCSYNDDTKHTEGGGEKYLTREFGTVQPLSRSCSATSAS